MSTQPSAHDNRGETSVKSFLESFGKLAKSGRKLGTNLEKWDLNGLKNERLTGFTERFKCLKLNNEKRELECLDDFFLRCDFRVCFECLEVAFTVEDV